MSVRKFSVVVAAVLAAVMLLAACGGSDSSSSSTSSSSASGSEESSAAGKKITFVGDVSVPAVNATQCGMKGVAEKAGVDFEYQVPDAFDPSKQVAIINSVVAGHPDVLINSPDDAHALVTPLKQAAAEGIDVVLQAHELADNSFVSAIVTTNDYADGVIAAELLAEQIGNKSGEVALLGFTPGASTITDARQEGFEDQIAKYPNLEFIGTTVIDSTSLEDGSQAANALMSSHSNLVGMGATSEYYSLGMAEAVAERGLKDKIATVQMEATPKSFQLLSEGVLDGISAPIWYELGQETMRAAVAVAAGEEVPAKTPVEPIAITRENMNSPEAKRAAWAPSGPC